jgi:hypothetical protein
VNVPVAMFVGIYDTLATVLDNLDVKNKIGSNYGGKVVYY